MLNSSPQNDHKQIAAYCRIPTPLHKSDLTAQIKKVLEYGKHKGLKDIQFYTDEAQSGTNMKRPGFDHLMEEVIASKYSMVIVPKFSKIAFSINQLLKTLDEFKKSNCDVISLSENFDSHSESGKKFLSDLITISKFEREHRSEQAQIWLAKAKAEGKPIGRKKTRPSELIRKLHKAGYKYREIARIAGVSHGSIRRELVALSYEEMSPFAKKYETQQNALKKK